MENKDFIGKEVDLRDEGWVSSTLAQNGHDHLSELVWRKKDLLKAHALLHFTGDDEGEVHDRCLFLLAETQQNIDRAFSAIYN